MVDYTFCIFQIVFSFAVLNVIGGIFLEKALANAQPDREQKALQKKRKDQEDLRALKELFEELDFEGDGCISKEELISHLTDEAVVGDPENC